MSNLAHRQSIIQEKRKKTLWREFVMEICSWRPINFYKVDGNISKYPNTIDRKLHLLSPSDYYTKYSGGGDLSENEDIDKAFFYAFYNLFYSVPHSSLDFYTALDNNINSSRSDASWGTKNVYLSISSGGNAENVFYSFKSETNVRNIYNSININQGCDNVYQCKTVRNSFNVFYSHHIYDSSNVWFSSNLIGCSECLSCHNLQNVSYYIENIQYSKYQYFQKKTNFLNKKSFDKYKDLEGGGVKLSNDSYGDGIFHCENIQSGYEVSHIKNGRNLLYSDGGDDSSNIYDAMDVGTNNTHHLYGVYGQAEGDHLYCSVYIGRSSYIYYSYKLENCSFCLGCIGLKNKSYCILNKQYSKEERYHKVDEIFSQMDEDGTLGEFFPATMNPFYFNDTAAYLIDPSFTKEEVTAAGYLWRDEPIKVDIPEGALIVKTSELERFESFNSQGNWEIDSEVLKYIIVDDQSNVYRIVKMEYDFLLKYGLPLPRKHWLERMKESFKIG